MRTEVVDGLLTLFYDGSKNLFNADHYYEKEIEFRHLTEKERWNNLSTECKKYWKERWSWEQVIVEEGVTVIPRSTFSQCKNIKKVILADTVIRIESLAFSGCCNLTYIKFSFNLEYIGIRAFCNCDFSSVFLPPSCREIALRAFADNKKMIIFHVLSDAEIGYHCIDGTKLIEFAPREFIGRFVHWIHDDQSAEAQHTNYDTQRVNTWVKNINAGDNFVLHRVCASHQPLKETIHDIIEEKGFKCFSQKNEIGITPSMYLKENPHTDLSDMEILRDYMSKKLNF